MSESDFVQLNIWKDDVGVVLSELGENNQGGIKSMNEELFANVLSSDFTSIKDDGFLLDNGYMSHVATYRNLSAMCYVALKPFVLNNVIIDVNQKFIIKCTGEVKAI